MCRQLLEIQRRTDFVASGTRPDRPVPTRMTTVRRAFEVFKFGVVRYCHWNRRALHQQKVLVWSLQNLIVCLVLHCVV